MVARPQNQPESSLSNLSVERFEREPLRFNGQLLADVATVPIQDETGARFLKLALYETSESDFVAGIIFCTSVPGEVEVPLFERLDEAVNVEDFFFAFEPDELLQKAGMELPSERRQQIASELYRMYEIAARKIFALTADRKEQRENVGDTEATKTS